MKKLMFVAGAFLFVLSGCGTEVKTLGDVRKKDPQPSCPPSVNPTFHEITAKFTTAVPAKISLILDGQEKINECKRPEEKPPIVKVSRSASNVLVMNVTHYGGYETMPKETAFQILDLGDCTTQPVEFASANEISLGFVVEFPNGKECGTKTYAKERVQFR